MQFWKKLVVSAAIIGTIATLGACRREVIHEPLKLGGDVTQQEVIR